MKTSTEMETGSSPRVVDKGNNGKGNIPPILQHLPLTVTEVSKEVIRTFVHSKRVGNYLLGRTLGEGSFAKVKEGLHVLTGEKVAIKVVDKKRAREDSYVRKNMRREGKLLQMVNHPNIVRLYEIMETENSYYLVTELCRGGDFMDYICHKKRLDEREVKKYIRQIISAVEYLHRLGILHRDLKVENLLLDENRDIKLIDFGLSNSIRGSTIREGQRMQEFCVTQCGSPAYAAPELLGHKHYGPKVDAWSIGVNMYAMLTGSLPFTVDPFNIKTLHNKMLTGQMNPVPDYLTKECRDLLRKFLTPDPEKRLSLADAMKHPWICEGKNKPMEPIPCPNRIRSEEICDDILHHMSDFYGYRISDVIRHVTSNMPGPPTALYHLFKHRLDKYKGLQRVRGKAPITEARNKENKISLLLKDPANVVAQAAVTGPITPGGPQKVRNRRPCRIHVVKEDTLEPKIIQLQISPELSVDVTVQDSPRNMPRVRPTIKLRKRETRQELTKTKEPVKNHIEKDIVLIEMSPADPNKCVQEGKKDKDSSSSQEPSTEVGNDEGRQPSPSVSGINKANQPAAHVIGTKYTRTILSELLPKQAQLRQRLSKHVTHHQANRQFQKFVDSNNNNVSVRTDNVCLSARAICDKHGEKDETHGPQPEPCQSQNTVKPETTEISADDNKNNLNYSKLSSVKQTTSQSHITTLKSNPPSKSPTVQSPTPFSPRRKTGMGDLRVVDGKKLIDIGKKLIDIGQTPYSRVHVSKSAGLASARGRLSRDVYDPKEILLEKCGGVVTKSKTKLQPSSQSRMTPPSVKQATFEMVSLRPISPRSPTDSKSSRSATNHSDKSASTKSSNVALPSIAISPTMMRTN